MYDEYMIDRVDLDNRVAIIGKEYGGYYEKLLSEMLEGDVRRRPGFG